MKRLRLIPIASSLALVLCVANGAVAGGYALSSNNVENFAINEDSGIVFVSGIIDTSNTTAILNGAGAGPFGGAGVSDAAVANAPGSTLLRAENNFTPLGIVAGHKYANGDAQILPATVANPDFEARNIAEALLSAIGSASGDGVNSSATAFDVSTPGTISFAFTADPLIQVRLNPNFQGLAQGVLAASVTITCAQVGGCGTVPNGGVAFNWLMNGVVSGASGVTGIIGGIETADAENLNLTVSQFTAGNQNHSLAAGLGAFAASTNSLPLGRYTLSLSMEEHTDLLVESAPPPPPPEACRVTGGGNDTAGINSLLGGYDGTTATDAVAAAPRRSLVGSNLFVYTFGGQAGASTALPPQPKGQWTHQNHDGPNGLQFNFKIGTSAAPKGTKIVEIICTDPDSCVPARPAPDKQIDFVGTGSFTSITHNTAAAVDGVHTFAGLTNVIPVPVGTRSKVVPTYHWFQVHIEDLGEPGSNDPAPGANCPVAGSGNNPFATPAVTNKLADCGCPDFYRITIYQGFIPQLDPITNNIINTADINKTVKIYEVSGYINGGNFQIHPPTGFDLK